MPVTLSAYSRPHPTHLLSLSHSLSLSLALSRSHSLSISLAVLPKPKNILPSRFRSGSADEEDLLGHDVSDYRY